MKLSKKFSNFIQFAVNYKLPKMLRKKSDEELQELYQTYSPWYHNHTSNLYNRILGTITVYVVTEELKRRYPRDFKLKLGEPTNNQQEVENNE